MADLIGLRIAGKVDDKTAPTGGSGGWPFDNIRTVSQTDANADHSTIAAAITAASAGDVILLDAETFTVTADIAVSKAVTIMGHPGGSIITSSTASVNILNITAAARIVNLTITHTAATGTNVGIKVDAANAIIENCTITLSGAASINYGVFHNSGNGLRVNNCFVTVSGASVSNYGYTNQLNDATAEIYGGKLSGASFDIHGSRAGSTLRVFGVVLANSLISYSGTLHMSGRSANADILVSDNKFVGLGAAAGRIEFDDQTTDEVNILDAHVGIGTSTPLMSLDVDGGVGLRSVLLTLANGLNSDITLGNRSFVRITGPTGAFSIGGFTGGSDGQLLIVYNTTTQNMTIVNGDAGSTAANRFVTMSGGDVTGSGASVAMFFYSGARWNLVAHNG